MKSKEWITIEKLIEDLKLDPDNEHEYSRNLGGILHSTHWFVYDSGKELIGDSTDWYRYNWYTETECLSYYTGTWWHRDV